MNDINKLIESHMENVEKAVHRYYRRMSEAGRYAVSMDDLRSAGYEGLTRAAHNYSSDKGASFSTFAYTWINKTIEHEIYFYVGEQAFLLDEQTEKQPEAVDTNVEDAAIGTVELSEDKQAMVIRNKLKECQLSDDEIVVFMAVKGIGREKVTNLNVLAKEINKREIFIRRINQSAEKKIKAALSGGV